ncbi:MAG: DUF4157 domain-containing protein [Enhygromyxa sp.]
MRFAPLVPKSTPSASATSKVKRKLSPPFASTGSSAWSGDPSLPETEHSWSASRSFGDSEFENWSGDAERDNQPAEHREFGFHQTRNSRLPRVTEFANPGIASLKFGRPDSPSPTLRSFEYGEPVILPKLKVGDVNDPLEREADEIAERVMRTSALAGAEPKLATEPTAPGGEETAVHRKYASCEAEDDTLRRTCASCEADVEDDILRRETAAGQHGGLASAGFTNQVRAHARLGGTPLPSSVRNFLEPRLGVGLDGIRLHADHDAGRLARQVNARAFTLGQDVFFAPGEMRPQTHSGMHLLAHEVAHTLQNRALFGANVNRRLLANDPGPAEAPSVVRRSCPKQRDRGEREQSNDDFPYAYTQSWGTEGIVYEWPVGKDFGEDTKTKDIAEQFKVWRVEGFAVNSPDLNGTPDPGALFKMIKERQEQVVLVDEADAVKRGESLLTGVRRAAVMFGRTDCMGDEVGNILLADQRKTHVETLAMTAGVDVMSEDSIDTLCESGGTRGYYQAQTIESAIATLPVFPADRGSNSFATDRKRNRSVLIVEIPVPATSSDSFELWRQQQDKKVARVRQRFVDGWHHSLVAGAEGHAKCILEKAKPYLVARIEMYLDTRGAAIPGGDDNEAYLRGNRKGCDNVQHNGAESQTFCEWFDMAMARYRKDCASEGLPWRKCKPIMPPVKPQYVGEELFYIFCKASLTRAMFAEESIRVAAEVIGGVHDFWYTRLDKSDGNKGDHPAVRSMLAWFMRRRFHVVNGRISTDKPNNSSIYSCFDAPNLFREDYSKFISDYKSGWGETLPFPY